MSRRRKKKAPKAAPAENEVDLAPVDRSAFDRVDPDHVPARRAEHPSPRIEPPKKPQRGVPFEMSERRIHGIWMTLVGVVMFFLMRMVAGQEAEEQKAIERVRTAFRPTICTIEGIRTFSGNKVGRRANYEYSWVIDGRGYRGVGYAPDGPRSAPTDADLSNAYPVRTRVECLYDPSSPSTAYLTTSTSSSKSYSAKWMVLLGVAMTLVGVGHLLYDPVRRRLGR